MIGYNTVGEVFAFVAGLSIGICLVFFSALILTYS